LWAGISALTLRLIRAQDQSITEFIPHWAGPVGGNKSTDPCVLPARGNTYPVFAHPLKILHVTNRTQDRGGTGARGHPRLGDPWLKFLFAQKRDISRRCQAPELPCWTPSKPMSPACLFL
jgi:hypothetical protein